jgi:hypothetical protein
MLHVPDTGPGKRVTGAGAAYGRPRGQPSIIRGGSRMQESCPYGSVRGAPSNGRPYRNRDSVRAEPISSQAASTHRYMTIRRTRGIDVANSQAQAVVEVDADLGNRGYRRDSH